MSVTGSKVEVLRGDCAGEMAYVRQTHPLPRYEATLIGGTWEPTGRVACRSILESVTGMPATIDY